VLTTSSQPASQPEAVDPTAGRELAASHRPTGCDESAKGQGVRGWSPSASWELGVGSDSSGRSGSIGRSGRRGGRRVVEVSVLAESDSIDSSSAGSSDILHSTSIQTVGYISHNSRPYVTWSLE
jgi:hypothetical protein